MNPYEYQFAQSDAWHNHIRRYDYYPENMSQEVSCNTSYRGFSDPINIGQRELQHDHFIERCSESGRNPYANQSYNYTSDNCSGPPRPWLHDDNPEDIEKRNVEIRQQYRLLVDQERQLRNRWNESHPDFQIDRNIQTMRNYSRMSRNKNKHGLYRSAKQKVSPGIPVKSNRSKKDSTFSVKTRMADSTTADDVDVSYKSFSPKEQTEEDKSNSTLKSKTVRTGILAVKVDQKYTESDLQQENNKTVCSGNMKPNDAGNSKDSEIIGKEIVVIKNDKNKPSDTEKNVTVDSNETQISGKKVAEIIHWNKKLKTANQESYKININTNITAANEEILKENSCNNRNEIISKNKTLDKNNSIADVNEMINKMKQKCSKMMAETINKQGPKDVTITNQTFHKPEHFDKESIISRQYSNETVINTNKVLNKTEDQAVTLNNTLQNEDNKIIFKEEVQKTVKIVRETFHKMPHVAEKKVQFSVKTVNKRMLPNGKLSCPTIVTHEGLLNSTVSTEHVSQTVVEAIQGDNNATASGKSINEKHLNGDKMNNSEVTLFGEAIQMKCLNGAKLKTFTEEENLTLSEKSKVLNGSKNRRRRRRRRTRRERRKSNINECRNNSKETAELKLSSKAVLNEQLSNMNIKSLKEEVTFTKKSEYLNDDKRKRFNETESKLNLSEKSEHLNNGKIKSPIETKKEVSLSKKSEYLNDDKITGFKETNEKLTLSQKSEHLNNDKMKSAVETKKEVTLSEKLEHLSDEKITSYEEAKKDVILSEKSGFLNDDKIESSKESKKEMMSEKSEHLSDNKIKSSVETRKEGILSEKLKHLNYNQMNNSKQTKSETKLSDKLEYLNDDKMKSLVETKKEVTLSEKLEHLNNNKWKSAVETKKEMTLSEKLKHFSDGKLKSSEETEKKVSFSEKSDHLNDEKLKNSEETKKEGTLSEKSGYLNNDEIKSSKEIKKEVMSEKSEHFNDNKMKSAVETKIEVTLLEKFKHFSDGKLKSSEETEKEVSFSEKFKHLIDDKLKSYKETEKEVLFSEKLKHLMDEKIKSSKETKNERTLSEKTGYLSNDKIKSSKEIKKEVMSEKSEHFHDNKTIIAVETKRHHLINEKLKSSEETEKEVSFSEKTKYLNDEKIKNSKETKKEGTLSEKSGYLNNDEIKSSKEIKKEVMSEKSEHFNDNEMKNAVETKKEVTLSEKLKHFVHDKLKSSEETEKEMSFSENSEHLNDEKVKNSEETKKEAVLLEKSKHLIHDKLKGSEETEKEVLFSEKLKHLNDEEIKKSEETKKEVTLPEKSEHLDCDRIKGFGKIAKKEVTLSAKAVEKELLNDEKKKTLRRMIFPEKTEYVSGKKMKLSKVVTITEMPSINKAIKKDDKIKNLIEITSSDKAMQKKRLIDEKIKSPQVATKQEVTSINSAIQKENLSNDKFELSTKAEMVLQKKAVQYMSPHSNAEISCQNKSARKAIKGNNLTVLNKVSDSVKYCNKVANSKEEILEILNRSLCGTKINNNCMLSPSQKAKPISRNEKVQCLSNADISPVVCEKDKIATSKQEICEILNRSVSEMRETNNNNHHQTLFSNHTVHRLDMEMPKKTDKPAIRHNMTNEEMINDKEFLIQIPFIQNTVVNNTINFDPKSNYKDIKNRIDSKVSNKVRSDNTCSVNAENVIMKCSALNVDEKMSSKGVKRNYSAEETHCIRPTSINNDTNIFKKQRQSSHAISESFSTVNLPSVMSSTPRSSNQKKFKQEKEKFSKEHDCSEIVHRFSNYRLQKPSSVIVIRQLPSHTTEENIFKAIEENNVTPLSIKIIKCSDPCSCGLFALIMFTSMKVAQDFMESKQGRMYINMYMVTMQYASCSCESYEVEVNITEYSSYQYRVKDVSNILSSQQNNKETVNISSSLLNEDRVLPSKYQCSKEQLKKLTESYSSEDKKFEIEMGNTKELESFCNSSTLTTDFDSSNEYPPPNGMKFTYDEAMECYHDSTTGLYYDARLKYFFNPQAEEILQYDVFKRKYVSLSEYSKSMDMWERSKENNDEELLEDDINKTILTIREWEADLKYQMIKMDLLT